MHAASIRLAAKQTLSWTLFLPFSFFVKVKIFSVRENGHQHRSFIKVKWHNPNVWKAGDTCTRYFSAHRCSVKMEINFKLFLPKPMKLPFVSQTILSWEAGLRLSGSTSFPVLFLMLWLYWFHYGGCLLVPLATQHLYVISMLGESSIA